MQASATLIATAIPFAVGFGFFYSVVKFFGVIGDGLSDDTRLEVTAWLAGAKATDKLKGWLDTFAKVFDRVYGTGI